MTKPEIRILLQALGFETDTYKSVYSKTYPHCKKTLTVDVDNEKINYDKIGIELATRQLPISVRMKTLLCLSV